MKRSKLFFAAILIAIAIAFAGCTQQITPADIQALTAKQAELTQQADAMQAAADQLAADMAAAGIVDVNTVAKIEKINSEADKVQAQVDAIATAISEVELTGDTGTDWIALLQAANTASSPVNPYVIPISAILSIAGVVFGWLKKKEADEQTEALTEIVKGVELFKQGGDSEAVASLKKAQDVTQSTATKQFVGQIKATV